MNGGRKIRPARALIILIISGHYIPCTKTLNSLSTRADSSKISASASTLEGELFMTLRLLSFICTVTAASIMTSIMVSCGGGAMSGGADAQKGKKSAESDDDATDPQVIAGAYLTCDNTSEANTEVSCNLESDGKKIIPTKSERIDYVADTGATKPIPRTSQNASYDAVFSGLKDISATKFKATMSRNSIPIDHWSCDGSKLPCKPIVKRTAGSSLSLSGLNGKWIGKNSDDYVLGKKDWLFDAKPAPADDYCDDRGRPVADAKKVKASWTFDGFLTGFTGLPDPSFEASAQLPYCVRKINGQTIRTGTKCSVVVAQRGPDRIHDVLVYPKDMSQTSKDQIAGLTLCN